MPQVEPKNATLKTKPRDFRSFLKSELVRRTKANPRFSLRAFAKMLDVQSGFLSKLLLGQRRITPATVRRFGHKLGLSMREIEMYESTCEDESPTELDFREIAYDHFQIISDWYHFAILELAAIEGFETDPRWISRVLAISPAEAMDAIDRLVRLNYISINKDTSWEITEGHTTTLGTVETHSALRQMQKQILEKAIAALENTPVERRDQSGMTMAIDSSRLPAAKEKVKKFRRELCDFLEGGTKKDSVYQLSISLYPLVDESKLGK